MKIALTPKVPKVKKRLTALLSFIIVVFSIAPPVTAQAAAVQFRTYQGSRYYYNILAGRSYGEQRQAIYNDLAVKAEILHQDFTTDYSDTVYLLIPLDDYFTRNSFGYFDLAVYEAVDETIAAFFDDNLQYCFLEKNTALTGPADGYTVNFYQPQPTARFPAPDLRKAADRRAFQTMLDTTFAAYEELTAAAGSRYETARLVHDKMVGDWDYSAGLQAPAGDPFGFSPGVHDLLGGMGYATDGLVCEAYAKTYGFLLNNLGVPAIFVGGDALAASGFPAGGHAWNIVEMDDGHGYYVDLTWADNHKTNQDIGNFRNPISYEWFLKGTADGKFEAKHYAGPGSFVGVYERPGNMGAADYAYRAPDSEITFLTDLPAERTMGLDLGTWPLPAAGPLKLEPEYYETGLRYGTDYELRFEEPLRAGPNRVWFIGRGNYRGLDFGTVRLAAAGTAVEPTAELPAAVYEYTGAEIRPVPLVRNGTVLLREGIDYTVAYQNNIEPGTATVVISGLGIYYGRYPQHFQITQAAAQTVMTGAEFGQIYPAITNSLVVITNNDGSRLAENFHNDALPAIQNAADYFGLPVYYLDGYAEDLSAEPFFTDMLNEFYRDGRYTAVECYPLLGIFKDAEHFGVYAASAITAEGGSYPFPFIFEEEIHNIIRAHLMP